MAASFLLHPQRVGWRAALFQVHLWIGLILGIYVCAVGISGSIVVLEEELTRLSRPHLFRPGSQDEPTRYESLASTAANVKTHFSGYEFSEMFFPIESEPALQFYGSMRTPDGKTESLDVYVDPATGQILGTTDRRFWLSRIRGLHVELLAGHVGLILNGCGAVLLVVLAATGTVIWWRGIRHWSRALRIDFRRKWSRINFDLHSAAGVWFLFFVLIWGVSGIYFAWPDSFLSFLDHFSPARSGVSPKIVATARSAEPLPLASLVAKAAKMYPGSRLLEVEFAKRREDPLVVVLGPDQNFRRATHIFFDPVTGEVLRTWTRGQGDTLGGRIIPWMADLHFGERFGLGVKLLWAAFGLALPVLAVTGALMYWNRFLAKKWRRMVRATPTLAERIGEREMG
jgi:uncharacterized iron-regulated membrane protein